MAKVNSRLVDPWWAIWLIHDVPELGYHDIRYHRIEHGLSISRGWTSSARGTSSLDSWKSSHHVSRPSQSTWE